MGSQNNLQGTAVLPGDYLLQPGVLIVRVLDTSEIDANATIVASVQLTFPGPEHLAPRKIPFQIRLPFGLSKDRDYSLEAQFIVSGHSGLAKGDCVSAVAQPISAQQHEKIEIELAKV